MTKEEGYSVAPNWLVRDPNESPNVKLVFLYLSGRVDAEGICYPSQALIAEQLGMSVSTVKRTLRDMTRRGLIEVHVRVTPRGRNNIYRLVHDRFGSRPPGRGVGSP